jgi:hypothetical protein
MVTSATEIPHEEKFLPAPHIGIPINWDSDQLALGMPFEDIQICPFTKGFRI